MAINAVRLRADLPGLDFFSDPPPTGSAPVEAATVAKPPSDGAPEGIIKHALKVSQIFDQGTRMEVRPCQAEEIRTMRKRWVSIMKLPPARNRKPTDNQLSVLHRL